MVRGLKKRLKKHRPHRGTAKIKCPTTSKACYRSKGHALSAALNRSAKGGRPLRAYRCPDCGFWHMTSRVES